MRGSYGTPMQVHSRFKNKKEYWKWVHLKNKPAKKEETITPKRYRLIRDGEVIGEGVLNDR